MPNQAVCILCLALTAWTGVSGAQEPAVAVLDSGTNANVNIAPGSFNFFNGTKDISDDTHNNHGTTSSLIVNKEAPGIPQFQYVITNGDFKPSASATDAAVLNAAANDAIRVIAFTQAVISTPTPSIARASDAGKFVAMRTGNDGAGNPAVGAVAASGLPGVVLVTGTRADGSLLPDANACGVAAARCVGLRGSTDFHFIRGTSFATARLAGIAAAVFRDSPFLSAEELAQVIFATAMDTGDQRLGNGFIANAAQVINNPAGPTSVADGGSSTSGVALGVAAAAGGALLYNANKEKLEKTLVLDSFGRPFHVDLTEQAYIQDEIGSISRFFDALEQRHDSTRLRLDDHHTLDAAYVTSDLDVVDPAKYFAFESDPAFHDTDMDWVLSLSGAHANGFHYQMHRNRNPAAGFGIMDTVYDDTPGGRSRFLSGQSFSMPLLGFSAAADSASIGLGGDDGLEVAFGLVRTDEQRAHGRQSLAAVVEGSYGFGDRAELSVQLGQLREEGNLFGGASNGTFSVDGTDTLAANVSAALRLADHTHLVGSYGAARSDIEQAEVGILKSFSTLRSDWFGLGVVMDQVLHRQDQFGVALSRPLRVTAGEVDLHVPHARDFDGNIYKNVDRVSLVPDGKEYTMETYYLRPLGRHASLGAYLMLRHEPNHVAQADTELTLLASYRLKF